MKSLKEYINEAIFGGNVKDECDVAQSDGQVLGKKMKKEDAIKLAREKNKSVNDPKKKVKVYTQNDKGEKQEVYDPQYDETK